MSRRRVQETDRRVLALLRALPGPSSSVDEGWQDVCSRAAPAGRRSLAARWATGLAAATAMAGLMRFWAPRPEASVSLRPPHLAAMSNPFGEAALDHGNPFDVPLSRPGVPVAPPRLEVPRAEAHAGNLFRPEEENPFRLAGAARNPFSTTMDWPSPWGEDHWTTLEEG